MRFVLLFDFKAHLCPSVSFGLTLAHFAWENCTAQLFVARGHTLTFLVPQLSETTFASQQPLDSSC